MQELPLSVTEEMQGDVIALLSDLIGISELEQTPKTLDLLETGAAIIAYDVERLRQRLSL